MKITRYVLLFILGILILPEVYATDYDIIAANNPLIEYTDRIDFSNPLNPGFSYSGASVRACFKGISIGLILSDAGGIKITPSTRQLYIL